MNGRAVAGLCGSYVADLSGGGQHGPTLIRVGGAEIHGRWGCGDRILCHIVPHSCHIVCHIVCTLLRGRWEGMQNAAATYRAGRPPRTCEARYTIAKQLGCLCGREAAALAGVCGKGW